MLAHTVFSGYAKLRYRKRKTRVKSTPSSARFLHSRPGYAESDREAVDNDDEWFSHKDLLPFLKNVRSVPPSVLTPAHSHTFIPIRRRSDGFFYTLYPNYKQIQT